MGLLFLSAHAVRIYGVALCSNNGNALSQAQANRS